MPAYWLWEEVLGCKLFVTCRGEESTKQSSHRVLLDIAEFTLASGRTNVLTMAASRGM